MQEQRKSEQARLAALAGYRIVGTAPDPRFDAILQSLIESCGAAMAKITFVDAETAWMKSNVSAVYSAIPRTHSFAAKYIVDPVRTVVIPDLLLAETDISLLIAGYIDLPVASLAGVPICAPNGVAIGALVIFDTKPRDFTMTQVEGLTRAARKIVELLESTRAAIELAGDELQLSASDSASGADLDGASLTDMGSLTGLVDNSHTIVDEFVQDNLSRSGWWAAQVWWAEDDYLYPDPWILDPVAPEVLGRLRSRAGAQPVKFAGEEYPSPTLVDLETAPWLGNLANIGQSGVRHLLVLDVAGAVSVALRLVFVVPEGIRVQPEVISALETGARLLPKVLRQEQARGELLYRSTHDTLTGLLNRRGLDQVVAPLADARASQSHAVMYLDLDHFKQVNDTHGHAVGDQLLKFVAGQITKQVRPTDSVVRLGGDEFVVLAKNIGDAAGAYSLGKRILNAVNTNFVSDSGVQLTLSTSIGVAMWNSGGTFDDSMRVADALMYQAKQAGGSLAVENLAGSGADATNAVALNNAGLELVTNSSQLIERTTDSKGVGLLISVESPLRSISAHQLADSVRKAISESVMPNPERVLLRFSNHFWNHNQLIPAVFDDLISSNQNVVFAAVIDSALIGAEPTEVMLRLAKDERVGIVLDGQGGAAAKLNLLDVLQPNGLTVPAEKLRYLVENHQPSRSLRAMAAVTVALKMDFYCLDWEQEAINALLAQVGIGFVSFKVISSK